MQQLRELNRPTISIAYLQLMVELMAEHGIATQALLHDIPIDPAVLNNPESKMSAYQWMLVILRAQSLSNAPGLGYEYGLRMRPTVHGVLGYAAMSSASLREALETSVRFMRARQAGFRLEYREDGAAGELWLLETQPIPVLRRFFYENILLGLARAAAVLLGKELEEFNDVEVFVDWPEPSYHQAWKDRLPIIRFNAHGNFVRLPRHYQNMRPVLADPLASQQAIALCERELALASDVESSVTLRVRAELMPHRGQHDHDGYPKLDDIAARLNLSARTLKRKLQQQGTSYLLLLEEARRRDAQDLLCRPSISIQDIATRLGYRNPANFTRAFKKWTGEPPASFRARQGL